VHELATFHEMSCILKQKGGKMAEQEKKPGGENLWESTRKTLQTAASGAQRYTRMVQKKIDLAATQRKIPKVHCELGKLIENLHSQRETRLLENEQVIELLRKLDSLRQMASSIEQGIDTPKKEEGNDSSENQPR